MKALLQKPYMKVGLPKVDLSGGVFYAPLWRPDMGGSTFYDLAGHNLCTNYGAIYGNQGRTFDGDDYIKNSTANWRSGDSSGAIEAWFKLTNKTVNHTIFGTGDEASALYYLYIYTDASGLINIEQKNNDSADLIHGGTDCSVGGAWHHVIINSSGTAWSIILDDVAETLTVSSGANSGDWFADTSNRDNFTFGVVQVSIFAGYMDGVIGEARIYSSPLTVSHGQRNRQATKWRYI